MPRYDVIVIGSGPNGLCAAIELAKAGLSVAVYEGKATVGGGMRTAELTLPGFHHDICSAIHPMAASSPYLKHLPLDQYGLEWITPDYPVAHPLDHGTSVMMHHSIEKTMDELGDDGEAYRSAMDPIARQWDSLTADFLGPLRFPKHPINLALFGLKALQPAERLARNTFSNDAGRALFAGLAAHSIMPLHKAGTSAIGMVLGILGHAVGWPLPKGGSQAIADALLAHFQSLGGEFEADFTVTSLDELPEATTYFFDTTPSQMVRIAGQRLSSRYKKRLEKFKYGYGVFKIDAALSEPIPWLNEACGKAGTVHVCGTFEECLASEATLERGDHAEKPYVLVAQQSLFDDSRAPEDHHTFWAYCHVPHGSTQDMSDPILNQIERFAPGFRDTILEMKTHNTHEMHAYNPNYIGGDINGGKASLDQIFTRPVAKPVPYRTGTKGIYLCSSSTPPGGGVHGMCGYHAARAALSEELR